MDPNRKLWNQQQQALQRALSRQDDHQKAIELFLNQHAMLHSAKLARSKLWSFEDEVWQGLDEPVQVVCREARELMGGPRRHAGVARIG